MTIKIQSHSFSSLSLYSFIFKLADFGTARKLGPEEKFTSLHGTEEYLVIIIYTAIVQFQVSIYSLCLVPSNVREGIN